MKEVSKRLGKWGGIWLSTIHPELSRMKNITQEHQNSIKNVKGFFFGKWSTNK